MQNCWICKKQIKPWRIIKSFMSGGAIVASPGNSPIGFGGFRGSNHTAHLGCHKKYNAKMIPGWIILVLLLILGAGLIIGGALSNTNISTFPTTVAFGLVICALASLFVFGYHFYAKNVAQSGNHQNEYLDLEVKKRIERQDQILQHQVDQLNGGQSKTQLTSESTNDDFLWALKEMGVTEKVSKAALNNKYKKLQELYLPNEENDFDTTKIDDINQAFKIIKKHLKF
ncbi:hypothetical protein [Williamsoniiplasma lucivorax]|uniref:Uncharacterized protein n=1 Tax=Williamsoniiplasma lucivorax TaxID=209274 RepID=A0A2S5RA94_9MOLU|nr:hypothetical protein [Williamsoniiplasma lucivorax]PPE04112.1 hypothetical protein ELUCI_v1c08920 [Williamsoniiplasma lucivorax]